MSISIDIFPHTSMSHQVPGFGEVSPDREACLRHVWLHYSLFTTCIEGSPSLWP